MRHKNSSKTWVSSLYLLHEDEYCSVSWNLILVNYSFRQIGNPPTEIDVLGVVANTKNVYANCFCTATVFIMLLNPRVLPEAVTISGSNSGSLLDQGCINSARFESLDSYVQDNLQKIHQVWDFLVALKFQSCEQSF